MYEKHLNLKEQREESKNYERDLINIKESLKKEEAINARLENQVKSFLEKRKYEESILLLKKKRAWMVSLTLFFKARKTLNCAFLNFCC